MWLLFKTIDEFSIWHKTEDGKTVWQVLLTKRGRPTMGSGGYYKLSTALQLKGL